MRALTENFILPLALLFLACGSEAQAARPGGHERRDLASPLNIRTCGLASSSRNLMGGRLSDFWAQNLIGADLLREDLESQTGFKPKENWIAIVDSLKAGHYAKVKNLILGEGPQAVLPELSPEAFSVFPPICGYNGSRYAANLINSRPAFINISMFLLCPYYLEVFQSLSHFSVAVISSGNGYLEPHPKRRPILVQASKKFSVVVTGSLSPMGLVSGFSEPREEVDILAPSDSHLASADFDGNYKKFGGTSGAAPLVTGSLAGFEWLSGYHPTGEEARLLLKNTAIPTVNIYDNPRRNGAGALNAYKLGATAKRLRQRCGSRPACFQEKIQQEESYIFDLDEEALKKDLSQAFPLCSLISNPAYKRLLETADLLGSASGSVGRKETCEKKGRALKKLRQAVLLSPEKKELWRFLSCVYFMGGFAINGAAFQIIAAFLDSKEKGLKTMDRYLLGVSYKNDISILRTRVNLTGMSFLQSFLEKYSEADSYLLPALLSVATSELRISRNLENLRVLEYVAEYMEDNWNPKEQGMRAIREKLLIKAKYQIHKAAHQIGAKRAPVKDDLSHAELSKLLLFGAMEEDLNVLESSESLKFLKYAAEYAIDNWNPKEQSMRAIREKLAAAAARMGGSEGIELLSRLLEENAHLGLEDVFNTILNPAAAETAQQPPSWELKSERFLLYLHEKALDLSADSPYQNLFMQSFGKEAKQ